VRGKPYRVVVVVVVSPFDQRTREKGEVTSVERDGEGWGGSWWSRCKEVCL
jgi:hypothetical protein